MLSSFLIPLLKVVELIGGGSVQGERLNYLLEERGPCNLTQIVNLCEIGPNIFDSVKFEAKMAKTPNS